MKKSGEIINLRLLIALALILFWSTGVSIDIAAEDLEKKYAPILGDYLFDLTSHGYGILKVTFYMENDKLLAITELSSNPGQMVPVEGKEYEFTIEDPDEGLYSIKFLKDDAGKYNRCYLFNELMGIDVTGERVP